MVQTQLGKRRVTLTFDNGPNPTVTSKVLDQLNIHNIRAWFCLVGSELQKSDEHIAVAKETLAQGHHLVNHSSTHRIPLGDNPSQEHAVNEIQHMHNLMNEALGNWGAPWFRPFGRGGQLGPHVFSLAALDQFSDLNYSVLLWNSVPRDWEQPTQWVDTAMLDVGNLTHTVVVLHDAATGAMDALPEFIDRLLEAQCVITDALPQDCVPFENGKPTGEPDALQALVAQDER